jgi:hypothetical protein
MKSLLKISLVVGLFLLCFASCLNDDNYHEIVYFYDEPAQADLTGDKPMVNTAYGRFYVPDLAGDDIVQTGHFLWTSFIVDYNTAAIRDPLTPETNCYTATKFKYSLVNNDTVILPKSHSEFEDYLSDSFSDSIRLATLYRSTIENTLFFGFTHKEITDYIYELVMNPTIEDGSNYPTLYIRAAKNTSPLPESLKHVRKEVIFAFDMQQFINYYKETISKTGPVTFNLKYKIGTDKEGKDVYRSFKSNPIRWGVSAKNAKFD